MKTLFLAIILLLTGFACGSEQPYPSRTGSQTGGDDALPDGDDTDPSDPEPSDNPDPTNDPEPTGDGAKLYQQKCSVCHRPLVQTTIPNKSADTIRQKLATVKKMKSIVITDEEVEAIAEALKK